MSVPDSRVQNTLQIKISGHSNHIRAGNDHVFDRLVANVQNIAHRSLAPDQVGHLQALVRLIPPANLLSDHQTSDQRHLLDLCRSDPVAVEHLWALLDPEDRGSISPVFATTTAGLGAVPCRLVVCSPKLSISMS